MGKNILPILVLAFFITSCNDDGDQNLLDRAPYHNLTDSIKHKPDEANLYYRRGSLLYSNEEFELAEKDLLKAWELEPKEEYAISVSIVKRHRSVDEAIDFLEAALKKIPNSLFIQVQLAQGYKSKGDLNRSLDICNRVIEAYPNNIDVYLLKAEILKSQNKATEAIATLEKAYTYAPGDVDLVHTLAFDYAETNNPKALQLSDSLIRADTEKVHPEPYYFKGVYFSNTNKFDEAIKQFDKAITTKHNFINAYINKGIVYFDQKKFNEAMEVFKLASRVFPDEASPYYWIGKTYEASGNKQEAKLNYQRACGLDKYFEEACEAVDRL
jgi:tetratricopeptide (TPR) repeat protein